MQDTENTVSLGGLEFVVIEDVTLQTTYKTGNGKCHLHEWFNFHLVISWTGTREIIVANRDNMFYLKFEASRRCKTADITVLRVTPKYCPGGCPYIQRRLNIEKYGSS